jgi:glutathione S-transferase
MLKVLGRRSSNNVQKVLWLLEELGVEFLQEDYGGSFGRTQTLEYRTLNPNATVPTLVDEAVSLWESNAILRYLAAKHGSGLYPTNLHQRAHVDKWLDWQLGTLSPTFRTLYVEIVRNGKSMEQVQMHAQAARNLFAQLDQVLSLQTYIADDALTLADIAIGPMVYRRYKLGLPTRAPVTCFDCWKVLKSVLPLQSM